MLSFYIQFALLKRKILIEILKFAQKNRFSLYRFTIFSIICETTETKLDKFCILVNDGWFDCDVVFYIMTSINLQSNLTRFWASPFWIEFSFQFLFVKLKDSSWNSKICWKNRFSWFRFTISQKWMKLRRQN